MSNALLLVASACPPMRDRNFHSMKQKQSAHVTRAYFAATLDSRNVQSVVIKETKIRVHRQLQNRASVRRPVKWSFTSDEENLEERHVRPSRSERGEMKRQEAKSTS